VESCQDSLPKALASFFEGDSYEDVVRNAVSLGGDTDTLGAIAGAMGDAMYGVTIGIIAQGINKMESDMINTVSAFKAFVYGDEYSNLYEDNKYIKLAAEEFEKDRSEEKLFKLFEIMIQRMLDEGQAPEAMIDVNNVMQSVDIMKMTMDDTFTLDNGMRLRIDTLTNGDGNEWIPLYTDEEELTGDQGLSISMNLPIYNILKCGLSDDMAGIVINPFGMSLTMPKEVLKIVVERYEELKDDENNV
jgi:hypothetical protein